jgi:DNA-binding NarL/FixJ family response regulator
MIRIIIADDHQLFIDGIKNTLGGVKDFKIVAEANNGFQVTKKLESGMPADIILMDINMPLQDGLECTKTLKKRFPCVRVIAFSQYDEKRFVKKMIKNGASGYILKDSGREDLAKAIRKVHDGGNYFSERLSQCLFFQDMSRQENRTLFPQLTRREKEILYLIGREYSTLEIAEKLFISFHTVETHRANLMQKAGVKNTAGLVRWATENDFFEKSSDC